MEHPDEATAPTDNTSKKYIILRINILYHIIYTEQRPIHQPNSAKCTACDVLHVCLDMYRQLPYPYMPSKAVSTLLSRGFVRLPDLTKLVIPLNWVTFLQPSQVWMSSRGSDNCQITVKD